MEVEERVDRRKVAEERSAVPEHSKNEEVSLR